MGIKEPSFNSLKHWLYIPIHYVLGDWTGCRTGNAGKHDGLTWLSLAAAWLPSISCATSYPVSPPQYSKYILNSAGWIPDGFVVLVRVLSPDAGTAPPSVVVGVPVPPDRLHLVLVVAVQSGATRRPRRR